MRRETQVFTILILLIFSILLSACKSGNNSKIQENEPQVPVGLEIGNRAPELAYESPQGDTLALSSLRGKMVLVDFWASWCPPCRRENPNLVSAYETFKDASFRGGDGFTIYSVSFDKAKDPWIKAIEDDSLNWPYHVSDLQGWESEASYIYDITSIPSSVLIDGKGIIVAKNLRDEELLTSLADLKK